MVDTALFEATIVTSQIHITEVANGYLWSDYSLTRLYLILLSRVWSDGPTIRYTGWSQSTTSDPEIGNEIVPETLTI